MGEHTPEAVEITCPGCASHFRLTPKKGRLPSGNIPCPKCSELIPIPSASPSSADGDREEKDRPAPAFGVTTPTRKKEQAALTDTAAQPEADKTEEAIARLERMAASIPAGTNATIAGFPGGADENPFASSRSRDKTAAVDRSLLEKLAASRSASADSSATDTTSDSTSDTEDSGEPDAQSWKGTHNADTSPRLVTEEVISQLAQEDSEAAVVPAEIPAEEPEPRSLLSRQTEHTQRVDPAQLRETAENLQISQSDLDTKRTSSIPAATAKAAGVLARMQQKKTTDLQKPSTARRPRRREQNHPTVPTISIPSLIQQSSPQAAEDQESEKAPSPAPAPGEKKTSLAMLFKKARSKDKNKEGKLRAKLREDSQSPDDDVFQADQTREDKRLPQVDISDDELDDIVERTTSGAGLPLPTLKNPLAAPDPAAIEKKAGDKKVGDKKVGEDNTEHSGLFDGFNVPDEGEVADAGAIQDVSKQGGKTTTQSMLARLQRRNDRGDNVNPIEVGAASERRGSGYIRLPTAEIQDVLGQGDFRLRIQNVIYEPVDRDGLIQLIKGGVLLGAEEIAEANGNWMPVSDHPVFGDLRRKMAAEAHQVLSRLGATQRNWAIQAPPEPELEPEPIADPGPSPVPELPPASQLHNDVSSAPEPDPFPSAADAEPDFALVDDDLDDLDNFDEFDEFDLEPSAGDEEDDWFSDEPVEPLDALPDEEPEPEPLSSVQVDDVLEPTTIEEDPELADAFGLVEDTDPGLKKPKKRGKFGLVVAALVILLGAAGAALTLTEPGSELLASFLGESPSSGLVGEDSPRALELDPTLNEARSAAIAIVLSSIPDAFGDPLRADAWARELVDLDAHEQAADLLRAQWQDGRRDPEFLLLFTDLLLREEDYETARRVALTGIELHPDQEEFTDLHRQAVRDDSALTSLEPRLLTEPDAYTAAGVYLEGDHRGFIFETDQGRQIFKPGRQGWEYGWRAEIAAWRFCELVACHFAISPTIPAVVTRDFLEGIGGDTTGFDALARGATWATEEIDGQEVALMRGSLMSVPADEAAPFPIEYRPLWLNWLDAGIAPDELDLSFAEHIDSLDGLAGGVFSEGLRRELGTTETSLVARQVSSLLIFDYLTNNWERFSTTPEDYGANNPAIDGLLYSRHNGDAFQPRASRRVQGRFEWTTRFSRSMVASIRALDPQLTNEVLFPQNSAADRARRDVMWSQRSDFLRRVDQLIARHGEENVLIFP